MFGCGVTNDLPAATNLPALNHVRDLWCRPASIALTARPNSVR